MKLTLQHIAIRSTNALDAWIEKQIFALQPALRIDEAHVRLVRLHNASPAYQVHVHLVTPGPDVVAEESDHTVRAAVQKVMKKVGERIKGRQEKRRHKVKSNVSTARSGLGRSGRLS